jgi:hypothetical protein
LSVLSLLLCVGTLALWVRSYWVGDAVGWPIHGCWVATSNGRTLLVLVDGYSIPNPFRLTAGPRSERFWQWYIRDESMPPTFEFVGFASRRGPNWTHYAVPMWFLALLFAILPALHLRALIRSRRLRRIGHCQRCGYDLRATPERCPECGAEVRSQQRKDGEPTDL